MWHRRSFAGSRSTAAVSVDGGSRDGLPLARRAALALTVATLLFGRQIASWSVPGNRFLYFWQRSDALLLILAVLLTALLVLAVDQALRRWSGPPVRRLFRLLFVLALVQLLVVLLLGPNAERPLKGAGLVSLLAAGGVIAAFVRAETTVVRAAVTSGLVFAPLAPILFLQMLTWRPWRECGEDRAVPPPEESARPVFVLVFDEWSLGRSSAGGEFLPELGRLRQLGKKSFVLSKALAPGTVSYKSIPRILFQAGGGLAVRNGRADWTDGRDSEPIEGRPNIFGLARSQGYGTSLTGWYLPYAALLGDDLDRCRVYLQEVKRSGALRLWDLLWANLQFLPDPLSRAAWRSLNARAFSERWLELNRIIQADAQHLARSSPRNTLAVIHYPLPHAPFIFEADGSYRGPFPGFRLEGALADYERHLRYLDEVLGRFIDSLQVSGRFDSALVVVTSDHGWQRDPDAGARTQAGLRSVPLLVKWPGQKEGASVHGEFCLLSLGRVIEAAIGDRMPTAKARVLIDSLVDSAASARCRDSEARKELGARL